MRCVNGPRIALASLALLVPSVVFAFNAYVSYRERALVEPYDIPSAIAFLAAALLAWRRSMRALVGGALLCAICERRRFGTGGVHRVLGGRAGRDRSSASAHTAA